MITEEQRRRQKKESGSYGKSKLSLNTDSRGRFDLSSNG